MSTLREAAEEALRWMEHARLHLTIKERMHPDGLSLYDSAAEALRAALAKPVAEEVEREREACAKACEDVATTQWDGYAASYNSAVFDCAAAIRARAEKETSNG